MPIRDISDIVNHLSAPICQQNTKGESMKKTITLFLLTFLIGCSNASDSRDYRGDQYTSPETRIQIIKNEVEQLKLFVDTYIDGVNNPFKDCETSTGLEKKICQIATTVSSDQQMEMKSQLAEMAKQFQDAIFGADCTKDVSAGCPTSSSILGKITDFETRVSQNTTDISSLSSRVTAIETNVSSLTTKVATLEDRLNNISGSGKTLEQVLQSNQTDITDLKTKVASILSSTVSDTNLRVYTLCNDNTDAGPIFEPIMINTGKTNVFGNYQVGSVKGIGTVFTYGNANKGFDTTLGTKKCHVRIYSIVATSKVMVCWLKTNRLATDAQIDAAKTANTATCIP